MMPHSLPKVVFTDIDGVWTDGGMYYDQQENEWKKFNTRDSAGVLFLRKCNIPLVILTGENTRIMERRAQKLKIEHCYQGVKDKVAVAKEFCLKMGVDIQDTAFIGDDIIDMALMAEVGFSGCPSDAASYVQKRAHVVLNSKGGEGAFREFVEVILDRANLLEQTVLSIYSA
jgi:3-deoxy-D-manno-octulosonate 8-phosphate phosphatase (KDO 8-P phosphatase)